MQYTLLPCLIYCANRKYIFKTTFRKMYAQCMKHFSRQFSHNYVIIFMKTPSTKTWSQQSFVFMQEQLWLFVHCISYKSMRDTQWRTFQSRYCQCLARIVRIFPGSICYDLDKTSDGRGDDNGHFSVFVVSSAIK